MRIRLIFGNQQSSDKQETVEKVRRTKRGKTQGESSMIDEEEVEKSKNLFASGDRMDGW